MNETTAERLKKQCRSIAEDFKTYGADYFLGNPEYLRNEAEIYRDDALEIEEDDPDEAIAFRAEADSLEKKAEICGDPEGYDIEYRVRKGGELKSVEIMVAGNGPRIDVEISSSHATVRGYWGKDREEAYVYLDARDITTLLDYYEDTKGF